MIASTYLLGPSAALCTSHRLSVETHRLIEFIDITDDVVDAVRRTRLRDGVATVFSRHTTAAIRVQEDESLLLQDLEQFLERLAPRHAHYGHNDFRVRTEHMHDDESPNGSSHCLHLLLGASETIPVADGELMLGTWQRVLLVELDGPRARREVVIQLVGVAS